MDHAPTPAEREALERLRGSLYRWYFSDLRKAASAEVDLPRLAFLGLAHWIDAVARLYAGNKGLNAWRPFIRNYLPERMRHEDEIGRLYRGLRGALSHKYSTRDVLLAQSVPHLHWTVVADGARILSLDTLLNDFEAAFEKFYADLESNPDLRARVLPRAQGLLMPVIVEVPSEHPHSGTTLLAALADPAHHEQGPR